MKTIEATATTSASPTDVWKLIDDVSEWTRWGTWTESGVEGDGPQKIGAVRTLVKRPFHLRERITEWEPNERMSYEVLEGMRVQGYRATVTLEPRSDGGTTIRWHATYERAGPLAGLILRRAIPDACRRLAKAA